MSINKHMNEFYVYCLYDENNIPRYIGKGKGNRMDQSLKNTCNIIIKRHQNIGLKFTAYKLETDLTEDLAFQRERYYINLYKRISISGGTLYNLTDGGEGACGFIYTPEDIIARYPNRREVEIINIHTKEVIKFISMHEASRYLNIPVRHISGLLDGSFKVMRKTWKLVKTGDVEYKHQVKSIQIKDLKSGDVHDFKSLTKAAVFIGCDKTLLTNLAKGRCIHINQRWVLASTNTDNLTFKKSGNKQGCSLPKLYKAITLIDTHTDEVLNFKSKKDASIATGVSTCDITSLSKGRIKTVKRGRYKIYDEV